jgi:hypothetical protein
MTEIHLYGKLRRYAPDATLTSDNVIRLDPEPGETLEALLKRLQIPVKEIYSIFFNARLLAARSKMATWIGYRQAGPNPFDWDLMLPVAAEDRIGLFGRDMAALVI